MTWYIGVGSIGRMILWSTMIGLSWNPSTKKINLINARDAKDAKDAKKKIGHRGKGKNPARREVAKKKMR